MAASNESMIFLDSKPMNINVCPARDPAGGDAGTEVVLGDMHGNSLKFLALLKKEGIIDIPDEQYAVFQKLYQQAYQYFEDNTNVRHISNAEISSMMHVKQDMASLNAGAAQLRMLYWNESSRPDGQLFEPVFSEDNRQAFQEVLNAIKVVNRNKLVTLLGDLLSDRGASDYFTLRILQHLKKEGMNYRIIFSNHDMEFVWQFERLMSNPDYMGEEIMYRFVGRQDRHQGASVHHLMACINQGIITREELDSIVRDAYYPHLNFIACSEQLDETAPFTFISHTPMSLAQCSAITAQSFKIPLVLSEEADPGTDYKIIRKAFLDSVEAVNQHFLSLLENRGFTKTIPTTEDRRTNPIYTAVWERNTSEDLPPGAGKRETEHPGLRSVRFVHGHDVGKRGPNPRENVYCLDDALGKDITLHVGSVNILALSDTLTPELSSAPAGIRAGGPGFFKEAAIKGSPDTPPASQSEPPGPR